MGLPQVSFHIKKAERLWKEIAIILFMAITGLNWAYYQLSIQNNQIAPTDAAFNIFVEVLGTGLTILVLDQLWNYEERKRWKAVKDDVNKLFSEEITEIFTDFAMIMIPPIVVLGETPEQIAQKTSQHRMNELNQLAIGGVIAIENRL